LNTISFFGVRIVGVSPSSRDVRWVGMFSSIGEGIGVRSENQP
jgi:hypothetical protein